MCLLINSGGWAVYIIAYLLLYPTFKCEGIPDGSEEYKEKCVPNYFCEAENNIDWSIVEEDALTLHNWMRQWDLYCASKFTIGMFAMSFFLGFTIGSIIVPGLSDKGGRKNWSIYSFTVHAACGIGIMLLPAS